MLDLICYYFLMFMIYSMLGYIAEVTSVSLRNHKFTYSRGFLLGPYLPIYGVSAVFMATAFGDRTTNVGSLFILCATVCTMIEFLTSYVMELIFKVRWWDYSDRKFNIDGRVCLENSCLFGLGGLAVVYIFNPIISKFLFNMNHTMLVTSSLILGIIFLLDLVISVNTLTKLKSNMVKLRGARDATADIKKEVLKALKSNILTKRTLKAYPRVSKLYKKRIEDIKKDLEELKDKIDKKKSQD